MFCLCKEFALQRFSLLSQQFNFHNFASHNDCVLTQCAVEDETLEDIYLLTNLVILTLVFTKLTNTWSDHMTSIFEKLCPYSVEVCIDYYLPLTFNNNNYQ